MRAKHFLLASAAALLAACATATPYQSAMQNGKAGYGFNETQIQQNRFNVTFSGNSLTNRETVETYLLYRAAELAVANGYSHFKVADKGTEENTRIVARPGAGFGAGYGFANPYYRGFACNYDFYHPRLGWRSAWSPRRSLAARHYARRGYYSGWGDPFYDPFYSDFDYREVTRFKANADIILTHSSGGDETFDARQVLENLGPKIVFPEDLEG